MLVRLVTKKPPSHRWLRIAVVLGATVATALAAVLQFGLWHVSDRARTIIDVSAVVMAAILSVWDLVHESLRNGREDRRKNAVGTARAVLLAVHVATGVPASDLGVSIFLVKGRLLPRLRRVHSERLLGTPAPSQIVWTKGKGIIGSCWSRGDTRTTCVDLRTLSLRYQSDPPTPEEFSTLHATGLTMGLLCDEFGMMINKYGEVLAVRIVANSGRTLGVLAVDVAASYYLENRGCDPVLHDPNVAKILHKSARDLGGGLVDRA